MESTNVLGLGSTKGCLRFMDEFRAKLVIIIDVFLHFLHIPMPKVQ